jgi:hypothetical protein
MRSAIELAALFRQHLLFIETTNPDLIALRQELKARAIDVQVSIVDRNSELHYLAWHHLANAGRSKHSIMSDYKFKPKDAFTWNRERLALTPEQQQEVNKAINDSFELVKDTIASLKKRRPCLTAVAVRQLGAP